MACLSFAWVYRETLRRCAAFLVENYCVRNQVEELFTHMYSAGHITESQCQYISETTHTSEKMTQLFGYLMTPEINQRCFDDLLVKLDEDTQRADIPKKVRETLEVVKNSSKNEHDETNVNIYDLLNKLQDNFMYQTPMEMLESMKTLQKHYIPRSFQHHSKFSPKVVAGQTTKATTQIPVDETTEIMRTLICGENSEDIVKIISECHDSTYLNSCNDQNQTILMVASKYSSANVVKTLLDNEIVEANAQDSFGRTAMVRQDIDVISALINSDRVDFSIKDKNGLGYGWYMFGEDILTELTSKVHVIQSRDDMEQTLDDCIVRVKDKQKNFDWENLAMIIDLLLSKPSSNHTDLLDVMVLLGNEKIVSLILQIETIQVTAKNLLDFVVRAIISNNAEVLKLITLECPVSLQDLPISEVEEIMRSVIRRADPKICETMLRLVKGMKVNKALEIVMGIQTIEINTLSVILSCFDKTNLNVKDSDGNSVFMILCNYGNKNLVSKMLELPDVAFNVRNSLDQSAFMLSLTNRCQDISQLLLQQRNIPFSINDSSMFGVTNLMYASKKGNVTLVKSLLEYPGVDINACDIFGTTALMYACSSDSGEVVSLLIKRRNIDVAASDDDGMTALLFAISGNNTGVIESVLSHKSIDVNTVFKTKYKVVDDDIDMTALMYALKTGSTEAVRLLLKRPELRVNDSCMKRYAIMGNMVEIVRLLLNDDRLDPNATLYGTTFRWAIESNNPTIIEAFLCNPNVDRVDNWNRTGLYLACERNARYEVIQLLLKSGKFDVNRGTPFLQACYHGNIAVVSLLLGMSNVDVNKRDTYGFSAITHAARRSHHKIIKMLLESDRFCIDTTADHRTLMEGCRIGSMDLVRSILATGRVNVNQRDSWGTTALITACANGKSDVVKLLLTQEGIDTTLRDDLMGRTALITACENGKSDVVKLLLTQEGIDTTLRDCWGKTALITACEMGKSDAVRLLLTQEGIDTTLRDVMGRTALITACERGKSDVVKLLLTQEGIDTTLRDSRGKTALTYARESCREVVHLLQDVDELAKSEDTATSAACKKIKLCEHSDL